MNRAIVGILLLLTMPFAFGEDTGLPVYPDPQEPLETGWLLFLRLPEPCDVYLGNEYQGRTPLLLSNLEPGTSRLTVQSESEVHRRELIVRGDIEGITHYTPPMHPFTGTLSVRSDPPGITASVNGIEVGATPLEIENLQAGEYRLSLVHPHFMPVERAVTIHRLDTVDLQLELRPAVSMRLEPAPPEGSVVEIYDESDALLAQGAGRDVLPVPVGYSRVVIRGDSFHPLEIEVQAQGEETTLPFEPRYYRPKLVFSNLLEDSRVFLDHEEVTSQIDNGTLTTVPGTHTVTVETEKYVPFSREIVLAGDEEVSLTIVNIRDPALIRRNKRIVILSTTMSGALLTAGSIVLNLDAVSVPISDTYEGYRSLKYTTIGTGGAGIVLLGVGVIAALLQ